MADMRNVIAAAYEAFNARNVDAALAMMTEDVSWPKASEGGRVVGKDEIRAYWGRQWEEFDPHVEPVALRLDGETKVAVRVHQVVRSLAGEVLADGDVEHVFTMRDGLIASMELGDENAAEGETSAAFAHR